MLCAARSSFADPARHAEIARLIRRRSSNPVDVRDVLLGNLDLSGAREILDLGCGFGFMSSAIASRVDCRARFIGVDACAANREPFLAAVAASGRHAEFVQQDLDRSLSWPDGAFDLVIASYSLYYFPELLPSIARVLTPTGLFLALTHSERSCTEMLAVLGLPRNAAPLTAVLFAFSAENAAVRLHDRFAMLDRVDYPNSLVFEADAAGEADWLLYVEFKLPLLASDSAPGAPRRVEALLERARFVLKRAGRLAIDKSDAGFRCRSPRWH